MDVKKIDGANAIAKGSILKDDIEKIINELANDYAKKIKMDGFRKGKVPLQVVKTRYKEALEKESREKCVNNFYAKAIEELKIDSNNIIGNPLVKIDDKEGGSFDVELKIGMRPEFDLDKLPSCIPAFDLPKIESSDVEKRLQDIANMRAKAVKSNKTTLEKNDIANIDFKGFLGDEAFKGGEAKAFDLLIGSNQFIPGFEDSIIGMKVNEEKDINVTFPNEYQNKDLAGKEARFNVKLNEIKEKEKIEINDAFAKSLLGEDEKNTLEKLKENVKKELEHEKKSTLYNEELKSKVLDEISKNISFDLPENIIEQEMNVLFQNELSKMNENDLKTLQNNKDKVKEKFESLRDNAKLSVKVTFIVDKYARENKIEVSDNEVLQTLYYEALMSGQDQRELIKAYKENNLLPAVKMAMIEDRVLTYLLDDSKGLIKKESAKKED